MSDSEERSDEVEESEVEESEVEESEPEPEPPKKQQKAPTPSNAEKGVSAAKAQPQAQAQGQSPALMIALGIAVVVAIGLLIGLIVVATDNGTLTDDKESLEKKNADLEKEKNALGAQAGACSDRDFATFSSTGRLTVTAAGTEAKLIVVHSIDSDFTVTTKGGDVKVLQDGNTLLETKCKGAATGADAAVVTVTVPKFHQWATNGAFESSNVPLGSTATTVDFLTTLEFISVNDVYELGPLRAGLAGGIERLATVRIEETAKNGPNTWMVLAGDLVSPSALSRARYNGVRLKGMQMIDVMNKAGLDIACFGNHEFDLDEDELKARISESEFQWTSANVFQADGTAFDNVTERVLVDAAFGIKVGFFGYTIDRNTPDWTLFKNASRIPVQIAALETSGADVIVAITHQDMDDDKAMVEANPAIDAVLGGHEHVAEDAKVGDVPILVADANALNAQILMIRYDLSNDEVHSTAHRLKQIDDTIPSEPATEKAARMWEQLAFTGYEEDGFKPTRVFANIPDTPVLDGFESTVRYKHGAFTTIIADAFMKSVTGAQLGIFNGGSVRIDDRLGPGPITEYDIIRALPFGGVVKNHTLTGELLVRVLEQGELNVGTGGFLHWSNNVVLTGTGEFTVDGVAIDSGKTYRVAISDFLTTGFEVGLSWFNQTTPGLTHDGSTDEVRMSIIKELERLYPITV